MASRPVVSQQAMGDAVVGGGKQKNGGAVEGRSRRALGDIGNLVTVRGAVEGKLPQVSRPLTRSFRAQLLANAQATAAAENTKKQTCVNVEGGAPEAKKPAAVAKPAALPKPIQKKVTVKPPKPEEVIVLSSDKMKEAVKQEKEKPAIKKDGEASARKKTVHAFTSVLSARSKAACGLSKRPKEQIVDIDAGDAHNDLAAVEYIDDIYKFYKLVESETRPHDYMDSQPDINEKMRAILIDWLIDVHTKFELVPETLYLTINIVDRFLAAKVVLRRELQLVGMSAMLMASKYEEIWAPQVDDLVCIADRAYSQEQILEMEKKLLGKLEWTLTVPTPYVFLVRFIKASIPDQLMENMVFFLAELGIMHYETIRYCPSMIAASAVYAARCTLNKTPAWNETLKFYTGFSEPQLMDCAKMLAGFHSVAAEGKLRVVYRKYSASERGAVSLLPAAKALLLPSGGSA